MEAEYLVTVETVSNPFKCILVGINPAEAGCPWRDTEERYILLGQSVTHKESSMKKKEEVVVLHSACPGPGFELGCFAWDTSLSGLAPSPRASPSASSRLPAAQSATLT